LYLKDNITHNLRFMYDMLEERDDTVSISFEMPTYEDHVNFVLNHPYEAWYIIYEGETPVGNIYLNKDDSWGCFIKKEYISKGYGTKALKELMKLHPRKYYYAHINPKNEIAIHNIKKYKGVHIQNTYKVECEKVLNQE